MKKALDFLSKQLDVYVIDYSNFLSDHMGYHNFAPMHFELSYYRVLNQTLQYIITEHPEKKFFADYPSEIHIDRILRLRDKTPS